jgi:lysophospholipase L1-like esterase
MGERRWSSRLPSLGAKAAVAALAFAALWSANPAESLVQLPQFLRPWVVAWQGVSTIGGASGPGCPSDVGLNNQTIRNNVFPSVSGDQLRVRLSNIGGGAPLYVGAATVALSAAGGAIVDGSSQVLLFGGEPSTVIAAEAEAISDPVRLNVQAFTTLAVSVYFPAATGSPTPHLFALQDNFIAAGNQVQTSGATPYTQAVSCWLFLSGLEVTTRPNVLGALITLGDSITDGYASTTNGNSRYPDFLARRMATLPGNTLSVSNAGLSGNDLLENRTGEPLFGVPAPARFARDVLTQGGVRAVILLEGINDIGANSTTAADLIRIDKQILAQARAAGVKVYGGTLLPFGGSNATYGRDYGSAYGEQQRQALNQWIRASGAFDGVVDFDQATRNPNNPSQLLPAYDSGDHLHPNSAGYQAMADAVDIYTIVARTPGR